MKKTIKLIVGFIVVLLFSSAFTGNGMAPRVGAIAPGIVVTDQDSVFKLHDFRGKYVLLSFWASSDARSRLKCNELDAVVKEINSASEAEPEVSLIAVNFDRSKRLFREIVRRDNLNEDSQFFAQGQEAERIQGDYDLKKGLNSFLIDPSGRIVAVNPDSKDLTKILSR